MKKITKDLAVTRACRLRIGALVTLNQRLRTLQDMARNRQQWRTYHSITTK